MSYLVTGVHEDLSTGWRPTCEISTRTCVPVCTPDAAYQNLLEWTVVYFLFSQNHKETDDGISIARLTLDKYDMEYPTAINTDFWII